MLTYAGKHFDPEDPKAEMIDLLDIGVALSRIPRFVGHTVFPYYVSQHCMLTASLVVPLGKEPVSIIRRKKLLAILHDADEAYTSDIPSPVKQLLKPSITGVEGRMMAAIYKHFDVDPPTPQEAAYIKELDIKAYNIEHEYLRGPHASGILYNPQGLPALVPMDCSLLALTYMREVKLLLEK